MGKNWISLLKPKQKKNCARVGRGADYGIGYGSGDLSEDCRGVKGGFL